MTQDDLREAAKAVLRVGDGRGFIIAHGEKRLVITAAHCLPQIPPAHPMRYEHECTFPMLGPLDGEPTIWAACLFVDVVADLAVLGPPDNQTFFEESDAYEELTESRPALRIGNAADAQVVETITAGDLGVDEIDDQLVAEHTTWKAPAWVLQLDGGWAPCTVEYGIEPSLSIEDTGLVRNGMSGSPIIGSDGAAIGVISIGKGINPRLLRDLPMWLGGP